MRKEWSIVFPTSAMKIDVVANATDGLDLRYFLFDEWLTTKSSDEKCLQTLSDVLRSQNIPHDLAVVKEVAKITHFRPNKPDKESINGDFIDIGQVQKILDGEESDSIKLEKIRSIIKKIKENPSLAKELLMSSSN